MFTENVCSTSDQYNREQLCEAWVCVKCSTPVPNVVYHWQTPVVEKIEVPQTVHFKRIKGSADEIVNELLQLNLTSYEEPLYLEICYKPEIGVNIHERILEISKDAKYEIVSWKAITEAIQSNFTWEEQGIDEVNQLSDGRSAASRSDSENIQTCNQG